MAISSLSRRRIALALTAAAFAGPALPQAAGRRYRVGWLSTANNFREPHYLAFESRLAALGLIEGKNLVIERRHADSDVGRLPRLADEMAGLKCDVLFGGGNAANLAALAAVARGVPIVIVAVDFDPVAAGFVASLARPGGNVTGVTAQQSVMPAKRLELLKECLPGLNRLAVCTNAWTHDQLRAATEAAERLSLGLQVIDLKGPPFMFRPAIDQAVRARAGALHMLGSGLWVSSRSEIIDLALRAKLPTMFHQAEWVRLGGLISYGFDFPDMWRRAADMVVRVLRGASPASIPMEQPSTFELAINTTTARKLGLKIPESIQIRAEKIFS